MLVCGQQFKRERMILWQYFGSEGGKPLLLVTLSPAQVLDWHKGTMYPESVLNRILFATRYTRHLNRFGYLRVQGWKLYGERGLSGEKVSVWVYDGSITVEYQTVTLSKYQVELAEDRKQIKEISPPRRAQTPFRSPQLTLIDVSPSEWRLYWRAPAYQPRTPPSLRSGFVQLPLFETESIAVAVGSDETGSLKRERSHLSLIWHKHD